MLHCIVDITTCSKPRIVSIASQLGTRNGVLHCSMSPRGSYSHIVQGGGVLPPMKPCMRALTSRQSLLAQSEGFYARAKSTRDLCVHSETLHARTENLQDICFMSAFGSDVGTA